MATAPIGDYAATWLRPRPPPLALLRVSHPTAPGGCRDAGCRRASSDFAGGKAHQGIARSACVLWVAVKDRLESLLRENSGYKLVLTGVVAGLSPGRVARCPAAWDGGGHPLGHGKSVGDNPGCIWHRFDVYLCEPVLSALYLV